MLHIYTSPDISVLSVQVTFDLSGISPTISLVNQSVGANLQNISYAFVVKSPSGQPIHTGILSTPDQVGVWTTFILPDRWPCPANQIEWSGAPYSFQVFIQDSTGAQYSDAPQLATIQRPAGNTTLSKNFYGVGRIRAKVECKDGQIFFEDQTNASYQGNPGTRLSSSLTVIYPIDETNIIPQPMTVGNFSTALVPITYNSNNYQFTYFSIYSYGFANNVFINIRYRSKDEKTGTYAVRLSVLCNIDLSPVVCKLVDLRESIRDGTCSDRARAEHQLMEITPALLLAFIGIEQPLTGIDVQHELEYIQEVSGWDCSCCYMPTGIIPQSSGVAGDYLYQIVSIGGDIGGTVNVVGNTIQFLLADKSYVFALASNIPTQAFSITPTTNGYTKTYTLNVNLATLANDLLITIGAAGNSALLTLFNSLVQAKDFQLILEGGCIFFSGNQYSYVFNLTNVELNGSPVIFNSVYSGGAPVGSNYTFTSSNLSAFQTYLNSLGIGTFIVTSGSPGGVIVTSTGNPNNLIDFAYSIGGIQYIANLTKNSAGAVPVSATYAIQQIIYYLCGFTDLDLDTSQALTIPIIQNGASSGIEIPQGAPLTTFLLNTISSLNSIISYLLGLGTLTCQQISPIFQPNSNTINNNNLIYGYKGSGTNAGCAGMTPLELFQAMLTLGVNDSVTMGNFCAMVTACAAGKSCTPFSVAYSIVTPYNTTCVYITGIQASFS